MPYKFGPEEIAKMKELHFAGNGEEMVLIHNGVEVRNFRTVKDVEDVPELLAQGRFGENKARKRRLNKLPFMPCTKEGRAKVRDEYKKEIAHAA